MINILSDLVSFKTVNPPGEEYEEISRYLKELFEGIGFDVDLIEIPEDYVNKYYIYSPLHKGHKRFIVLAKNDKEPIIHFNAHYDVVPPGSGWVTDPFKLKLVDNIAYGRGVSDMKGGIVSMYLALSNVKAPVEVSIVPDEESGGLGSRFLAESGRLKAKYTIIGEPSYPNIYIGHYGIIRGIIRVEGKQVHASIADEGENAFILAAKFALELNEKLRKEKVSVNLGGYTINSSNNDGIVPGEFAFSFYRTTLPGEENVEREIREIVDEVGKRLNIRYEMEVKSFVPGSVTDPNSKLVRVAEGCVYKIIGVEPKKLIAKIRYDAVFFKPFSDVINIGPGIDAHIPNESVDIRNISKVGQVYECIIRSLV